MSRIQLAINVTDIDAAVDFYSKLFKTAPAKRKPGYANFAIDEPALKLVLIENAGAAGTLNHLGVEVFSTGEVADAQRRLEGEGLSTADESGVCCYAQQEKVWVDDPDGAPWEIYTVLADSDIAGSGLRESCGETGVCGADACATPELADVPAGETSVKGCC
ncbi:MAG TPA: ArsI/CadI family heavy metal resistance metalloenzyme [Acidimicrobiales bacterium]|nr:ArsI/CadI family heavy metal resistance metalloenzyme [Acidimicrobiales bacterium]